MRENRAPLILIILLLAAGVLVVYGQAGGFGFIRYDDELYVTANRHVQKGLGIEGVRWAFTSFEAGNWHPLTWLSLMLDHDLYGMDAGGYHWTNVILHLAGGLALFGALLGMTGRPWRSGLVAGLFLVHPLHVESVAWVAERKDVLSGLFWMLGLWGYSRYAGSPTLARYGRVVLFFVLGLMSKPMVVTLPLVLLLLDYWPLGRTGRVPLRRLVWEKVPLLALAAASSAVTFMAQQEGEAVATLQALPLADRLGNAVVAYAAYLAKTVRPVDLAVFYPRPAAWTAWQIVPAAAVLAAISVLAWLLRRSSPYLTVGWLWFLGTLVPVIGLVQVGDQAMADRYTYLPLVGIFIMAAWGSAEAVERRPRRVVRTAALWTAAFLALLWIGHRQAQTWQDGPTLFGHALAATSGNYLAHNNLGAALMDRGDYPSAERHFREALRIRPDLADARNNLGIIQVLQGKYGEAALSFREALRIRPDYPGARRRLGDLLLRTGKAAEAAAQYGQALARTPDDPELHNNLAVALASEGRRDEAIGHLERALALRPGYGDARGNLDRLAGGAMPAAAGIRPGNDREGMR